jgi:DNA-binding CsgD family transcriptional regulator
VTTIEELKPTTILRNCFRCGAEFWCDTSDRICTNCRSPKPNKKTLSPNLSFREKQVVNLVCQAKLNKEIAYELHLTEGTIKEYLNRIFRKVGASNRTELAVWALTNREYVPVGHSVVDTKSELSVPTTYLKDNAEGRQATRSGSTLVA